MRESASADFVLRPAIFPEELAIIRELFVEYQHTQGVDLCFQDFDTELQDLPGYYTQPDGALWLALVAGEAAGCVALRSLPSSDHLNACEMKRLYVRKAFRGFGLGRRLIEQIMTTAQQAGYTTMLLDTLTDMETARSLYQEAGFVEVAPYYHNPLPGAHYLKAEL